MEGRSTLARSTRRLAAGGAFLIALLVGAEGFARATTPAVHTSDVMIADAELGFRNVQSRVTLRDERGAFDFVANSLGCRGPELPASDAARGSEARVLLLGDSFLQAWGVREEAWVGTALREALARDGRPAEVYALSGQDHGTAQELLALRAHGGRVRPHTVVLFLFPCNDVLNNTIEMAGRARVSPGDYFRPYLVPDGDGGLERRYALPWRARLRASRIFQLLERRWVSGKDVSELRGELSGEPWQDRPERVASGLVPEQHFEIFRAPAPGDRWDTAWRTTEAVLLALRDEVKRLGARFTVVVIPLSLQVERNVLGESYDAELRAAGREPLASLLDLDLPERRLEELFHREGIEHVQLLAHLRDEVERTRGSLYMPDGHLGGSAHMLMGRLVAARLESGARDECFAPGLPVDVPMLAGPLPIELDLTRHDHWAFFGWGWTRWVPPAKDPRFAGWAFDSYGVFLARGGSRVTLRGVLKPETSVPATLTVAPFGDTKALLLEQVLAASGPFSLVFDVPPGAHGPWVPLSLRLQRAPPRKGDAPPRLLVQGLSLAPLPASGASADGPPGRAKKRALPGG